LTNAARAFYGLAMKGESFSRRGLLRKPCGEPMSESPDDAAARMAESKMAEGEWADAMATARWVLAQQRPLWSESIDDLAQETLRRLVLLAQAGDGRIGRGAVHHVARLVWLEASRRERRLPPTTLDRVGDGCEESFVAAGDRGLADGVASGSASARAEFDDVHRRLVGWLDDRLGMDGRRMFVLVWLEDESWPTAATRLGLPARAGHNERRRFRRLLGDPAARQSLLQRLAEIGVDLRPSTFDLRPSTFDLRPEGETMNRHRVPLLMLASAVLLLLAMAFTAKPESGTAPDGAVRLDERDLRAAIFASDPCSCFGCYSTSMDQITCPSGSVSGSPPLIVPTFQVAEDSRCELDAGQCGKPADPGTCKGAVKVRVSFPSTSCRSSVWVQGGSAFPEPTEINATTVDSDMQVAPPCGGVQVAVFKVWFAKPSDGSEPPNASYRFTVTCSSCATIDPCR
jgi:hypothetical protein